VDHVGVDHVEVDHVGVGSTQRPNSADTTQRTGSADGTDAWDAQVYGRYADERSRPFHDLLARVQATDPAEVVDLGCGSGSGLSAMARRWPGARLVGVDSSADMLDAAGSELAGQPGIKLVHAQAESWAPEHPVDVLVSNALLQWIPNHADLLSAMAGWLAPAGWLAIQVPGNFDAPSHLLLRQLVATPQWTDRLRGYVRGADSVFDTAGYFGILDNVGLTVDAWETTYLHELNGQDAVLRWTSGTALRPILAVLDDEDAAQFSAEYAALLRAAYPADETGRVLFPFRRIFAVGRR